MVTYGDNEPSLTFRELHTGNTDSPRWESNHLGAVFPSDALALITFAFNKHPGDIRTGFSGRQILFFGSRILTLLAFTEQPYPPPAQRL